jgi:hypothetical protein
MKSSVIKKIAEWLETNGIRECNNSKIDTDGYSIYSETELGCSFTNYNDKRYNFRVNAGDESETGNTLTIYGKGVKLFELYETDEAECGWKRNMETALYFSDSPSKSSLEQLGQWFAKNTQFTPFPKFKVSDFEADIKDFIYKVEETSTLKVQSNYDSVDSFFADKSESSYSDNESIVILAVDTKLPIIKLEKQYVNDEKSFKFIVDIKTKDKDRFMIKTTIDSKEKFISLLESTINSLKEFELFYKYAEDLENCL